MDDLLDLISAIDDPQMRHAMFVHVPIVLSMLGMVLAFIAAILNQKRGLKWIVLATFLGLLIIARITVGSGEDAHDAITGEMTPAAHELVEEHEEMAERVWLFALATSILVGVSFLRIPVIRHGAGWAAVLSAAVGAGWIAVTAHHGGTLVYQHGVGMANLSSEDADDIRLPSIDPRMEHFYTKVLPILQNTCWKCHNPSRKKRAGGLDQTTIAGLLAGGESGPALVPGRPEKSEMIRRITAIDDDDAMPPKPRKRLDHEQIEVLRQWINDGVAWDATAAQPKQKEPG